MPDLHDLLDDTVGAVPAFDLGALARRRRRHRQHQVGVLASVVLVLALVGTAFAMTRPSGNRGVAVRTHDGPRVEDPPTTVARSTSTSIGTPTSDSGGGTSPPPSSSTGPTTTLPVVTVVPGQSAPQAGDFTGDVRVSQATITAGDPQGVEVTLNIHNATDHTINVSSSLEPTATGLVCAPVDAQGRPAAALTYGHNFAYVTNPALDPGDDGGTSFWFQPDAGDVGTITCEGIIFRSVDRFVTFVAPMTHVTPLTITVTAPDPTTTTTAPADTTTTTP
jgi:hypothetical protein